MKTHLNTLFVTLEGSYLRKDGAAIEIRHDGESKLRVPMHNLEGVVCFGWDVSASASLMASCAEANVSLSFHNPHGKFLVATNGYTSGNISLRREQYRRADCDSGSLAIAAHMIAAKIANSRNSLLRTKREQGQDDPKKSKFLEEAIESMGISLKRTARVESLDSLRGVEGEAAASYFSVFPELMNKSEKTFEMKGRNRRPPLDPVNALLSFCYTLLMHDCRSALESCGLDAQCGFLHRDRPGRPSLALDLMEEFRAYIADRVVLSLINRRQIKNTDFYVEPSGAVMLKDDSRKKVLLAWQERKKSELVHPFIQEKCTIGLLPHLQARLLARHLRGDLDAYPAFLVR
ncbi:type I-C CRISPR-associated endonuclease Cas1c [Puniceicoccaceae bacterium K14]|nr:type I-C CRISPR-associated endonuclease Cas1c [Puniceicoccaceae bacterium K14]